jgi:hypothetical protein
MSIKVMSWVWDHSRSKKIPRLVLLAIADCANDEGRDAYPSMAKLVQKTGVTERAVQTAILELSKLGELVVNRNGGPSGCNRYRVIMSAPPKAPTPAESAPPQNLHPAESAVSQTEEAPQVSTPNPAESAPPRRKCTPPQNLRHPPAESAPGTVLEPSVSQEPKNPSSSEPTRRPDVETICTHLADWIEANGSRRPTITKSWRRSARLLLDADHRTVEQVIKAIDWCQNDTFWRGNVMSMPKLREKYDQLRLAAARSSAPPGPRLVEHNGMRLKPVTAQRMADRERFAAMDAAQQPPRAIGAAS